MPDRPRPDELEAIAIRVSRMAAEVVAEGLGRAIQLRTKSSPTDIVTDVDEASEAAIRVALLRETPGCGIMGEEGGGQNPIAGLQWVVDPLDGTVNFSYGVPVFAVSVAAALDGDVVAGAVVDVVRGDVFSSSRHGGARRNGDPITASACPGLSQALVATGFSYHQATRVEQARVLAAVLPAARDIRCFGSAALNLCWLGAGWIDGYFERDTKVWDYAAGALVAEEAGAIVELPCPENDGLSLAATAAVFEPLRALVDGVLVLGGL